MAATGANGLQCPDLDVQQLHSLPSEQQEVFLLTFTSDLTRFVQELSLEDASAHQVAVKKLILKLITLSSPRPSRVIRNNLGRCFAGIFAKGDRRLLFESINDLVALVTSGKSEPDLPTKHAAIHCLGAIYEAAGDSAINLSTLVLTTLLRVIKHWPNQAGIRASAFRSIGQVYALVGGSADEHTTRDVWKHARAAASGDKSLLLQARACHVLEHLVVKTSYFDDSNNFEKLQSVITKAMDSHCRSVRRASASCLAAALVKNYSEESAPKALAVKKPKKQSKKGPKIDSDMEEIERPGSPAPSKPATLLSFTLPDILHHLSAQYTRTSSSRGRSTVAQCYIRILNGLGEGVIEGKFGEILSHLFNELLNSQVITNSRYRLLFTRELIRIIISNVTSKNMLGESAQLRTVRYLINDVLKDYPQVIKERPEPSKFVLTAALEVMSSMIRELKDAASSISDLCREALLQVLVHPNYTVQIHAAFCLQQLASACPQQLLPCATICMNSLNRELSQLGSGRPASRRCGGYAHGLSAVISVSTRFPLYGSVDVFARVFSQATTLLKSSSSSDIRVSSTQVQVAWILLSGLMSLGPDFVKVHTSQLLLLWRNALQKLSKETLNGRNLLELSFLTHVRECALGSVLTFLTYNKRLLTIDVTKRLTTLIHNTSVFLTHLPAKKTTEDASQRLFPALQLYDLDIMVRRRLFQCYTRLIMDCPHGCYETLLQSNPLALAIACFSKPDNYQTASLSSFIANSAANFDGIWDVGDNYGFGVTSLVRGLDIMPLPTEDHHEGLAHWTSTQGADADIETLVMSPFCRALEHDFISLYTNGASNYHVIPYHPATQVVDSAIQLFAIVFPQQTPRVQESALERLSSYLSDGVLQRDPGRRAAMSVNISMALLCALKVALKETALPAGNMSSEPVENLIRELLRIFVVDADQFLRNVASQCIGRLCKVAGATATGKEIDGLIELIISNREPGARSGCAAALGNIYSQLGSMTAGLHLKKILGVLSSLSSDAHPTVHFWALEGVSKLANSAGLNFGPFVASNLRHLAQLFLSETHNEDVGSIMYSNLEFDMPTTAAIARCVDSLINVLGPDLQEAEKPRSLIITFIQQFQTEPLELVLIESLRCQEHMSLFAPGHLNTVEFVRHLQDQLNSTYIGVRSLAIDCLHNLMRRDSNKVIAAAGPGLEDAIWLSLDRDPEDEAVKNIMWNWLHQFGLSDTVIWIQRCHGILAKTRPKTEKQSSQPPPKPSAGADLQDEEVAGFAAAAGVGNDEDATSSSSSQDMLKWQTRSFAMELLGELIAMIMKDAAANESSPAKDAVQSRVSDVVRMAFSSSTSSVVALRLQGIKIVDQTLRLFGKVPDPDFPEVSLLEQFQAQIGSALTAAFAADSSPELASAAAKVCATFIGTGIVTDVDRMGRILKVLSSGLEAFAKDSESASIGDLKGLSANALVMVKMSIFSAWAELQIASVEQKYLVDVLKPNIAKLTPLWLASLREFAHLRYEPDNSATSGQPQFSGNLDWVYASLNRGTLLQFYQSSWLKLVDAIASLIDEDSEFVFDALDGKTEFSAPTNNAPKANEINYRDEPVAFFFVLFGLACEALMGKTIETRATKEETLEILQALKKILRPSVSGLAIYQEVVFSETMDMFDRLVLTDELNVQSVVVEIARNLCLGHPSARKDRSGQIDEDKLSEDIDQLFELTRIIILVLAGLVPNLTEDRSRPLHDLNDEATSLLTLSISALVEASSVFPTIIETDLHACIFHILATIIESPQCQESIVPQTLPIMKRFVTAITSRSRVRDETRAQVRTSLAKFMTILKRSQLREEPAADETREKNALLACTILLSSASAAFSPADPLIPRFSELLADCLDSRLPSKVAASCVRSLILQPKRNSADDALMASLLPHVLSSVGMRSETEGLEQARSTLARALTAFATTPAIMGTSDVSASEKALASFTLVIPTLVARTEFDRNSVKETAALLLECAAADSGAFRSCVSALNDEQRKGLEAILRESGGKKEVSKEAVEEPRITLKMDFGL